MFYHIFAQKNLNSNEQAQNSVLKLPKKDLDWKRPSKSRHPITKNLCAGKARLGDRPEVADERRSAQLEQGLHQDQGAAQGQGDRLLLREPLPRQGAQAKVRRVWPHFQKGGLLVVEPLRANFRSTLRARVCVLRVRTLYGSEIYVCMYVHHDYILLRTVAIRARTPILIYFWYNIFIYLIYHYTYK